jgi:apolipoprotein D and lipocalin family protein
MKIINIVILSLFLASCAGVPDSIKPVTGFDLNKYTGKWYEIARLDHRFERGLEKVTATYSINNDGSVRVENRGFSTKNKEWSDAVGKAKFAGDEKTGHLKVSFFGPFYGSYVIFDLDKEGYQHSFVTGSENSLWLLSRTPEVSEELKDKFLNTVQKAGYNTESLIFVNQE